MENERRNEQRFKVTFKISSNEIEGKGINISLKGLGVITKDELVPADNIPFLIHFNDKNANNKEIIIRGWARLLYSKPASDNKNFYNGFEFINFEPKSKDSLLLLLKIIHNY